MNYVFLKVCVKPYLNKQIKSTNAILLLGFRDWVPKELQRVGCVELLNTVQRRVRPKLHVFGGIHEGKK